MNPLITTVVEGSVQFDSTSEKFNNECCIKCNNKELVRAVKNNNRKLFDIIFKSKKSISSVMDRQGCHMNEDVLTMSMEFESPYYFEKIMSILYNNKKPFEQYMVYTQPENVR